MSTNEFARILLTWIKSFLSWIGIPRDRLNELDEIIFLSQSRIRMAQFENGGSIFRLSGNFWLVSFKISYLCLPLFYETRTTPSCHPSGCAYRQL